MPCFSKMWILMLSWGWFKVDQSFEIPSWVFWTHSQLKNHIIYARSAKNRPIFGENHSFLPKIAWKWPVSAKCGFWCSPGGDSRSTKASKYPLGYFGPIPNQKTTLFMHDQPKIGRFLVKITHFCLKLLKNPTFQQNVDSDAPLGLIQGRPKLWDTLLRILDPFPTKKSHYLCSISPKSADFWWESLIFA